MSRQLALSPEHCTSVAGSRQHRIGLQRRIAGQAKDIIDASRLAPVHHLGPPEVAVAADGDGCIGPVASDRMDQAADVTGSLLATGRAGRAQEHPHRSARAVIDMQWRKAALLMEAIPERQLLAAVGGIERVIDVQHHRSGGLWIAGAVEVHHRTHHARQFAHTCPVLQPRQARLARQTLTRTRCPTQRHGKRRVVAQAVMVVTVLIARRNRQHPRSHHVGNRVPDPTRITPLAHPHSQLRCQTRRAQHLPQ